MSFLFDDVNNFIVGSEEGVVYTASRHGNKGGINESFEGEFSEGTIRKMLFLTSRWCAYLRMFLGHMGPVTGVNSHSSTSLIDLSHLFLSCSLDWTIKLWSSKVCSFFLCCFIWFWSRLLSVLLIHFCFLLEFLVRSEEWGIVLEVTAIFVLCGSKLMFTGGV